MTATIVDHIDGIMARDAAITVQQYSSADACFFASTDGALVDGVPWQIDFDTLSGDQTTPNCVEVWLGDRQPDADDDHRACARIHRDDDGDVHAVSRIARRPRRFTLWITCASRSGGARRAAGP